MGFQALPSWNGRRHLPFAKGPFLVGTADLKTKSNLLMRCFYPVANSTEDIKKECKNWPLWLPESEYADGYLKFKFSNLPKFLGGIFSWLIHNPSCPTVHSLRGVIAKDKVPTVIFSHGMGAMRTTYSLLCSELASNGFFVAAIEHKDGSASATINIDGTWTYERKIDSHENEYEVRNAQVTQRVTECEKTYDLLNRLALAASRGEEDLGDLHEPPGKEFLDSLKYLDMDDKCYISGHSFGGATGLKALYTSKKHDDGTQMFKKAILYDSWLFPIREEAADLVKKDNTANVLFLNCQKFQSRKNLATMKYFEKLNESNGLSNIITLRETMHYAPCDIPTVLMGSWARIPFSLLFNFNSNTTTSINCHGEEEEALPAWKSLGLCSDIGVKYLSDSTLKQCLEEHHRYLIYGTDYLLQT